MSKTRLTLIFSGTHMTWEDMALLLGLGANKRHNFRSSPSNNYFYIFDGPAATTSDQHKPVEKIHFDEKQEDFMGTGTRKMENTFGDAYRFATGSGMKQITKAAYQLILHAIQKQNITQIDLIGFSRGGNIALNLGSTLSSLEKDSKGKITPESLKEITANIYAIDPVAGKFNNLKSHYMGKISPFVKKCVVGLATNESVPGFHPREITSNSKRYNIQFHPGTEYVFLPFPEDHAMAVLWMKDIIRAHLPADSELLTTCDEQRLIERRLGIREVKWSHETPDETRAYRLIHYHQNRQLFSRPLTNTKEGIETFFKFLGTQRSVYNIGHISLQNTADTETKARTFAGKPIGGARPLTSSTQTTFAKRNHSAFTKTLGFSDRACKQKLEELTNFLFVNLLHEALFMKTYPNLYQLFVHKSAERIENAIKEFETISEEEFPLTKAYIENALIHIKELSFKPFSQLKSTNIKTPEKLLETILPELKNPLSKEETGDCRSLKLKEILLNSIVIIPT